MSKKSRIYATATMLAVLAGHWVWAAAPGSPTSTATNHSAETSSGTTERLEEVTVTARRAALTPRVSTFVNQIAELENVEGLPVWTRPACPLVSGLSKEEGEFIVARVSQIARVAAVPHAGENCRPNLFIL
jgi:hypothetical protein